MGALGDSGATGSGPGPTNPYVYTGNSVGRPLDIIDGGTWAFGQPRLGGSAPVLITLGSNTSSAQVVALTTTGLYAWGDPNTAVLSQDIKSTQTAGPITVNGKTDGLPPGVSPNDVAQLFATNGLLALVTKPDKGGEVWTLVNKRLGTGGERLRGDGSTGTATDNEWHRVRTNAAGNPVLQNALAVRGQVGGASKGALMVHTSDGVLYAWGYTPYFGDGAAVSPTSYATPMTLPQESGNPITPKMIGVTGNSTANNTMFVLSSTGTLYSVGANNQYQLGAGLTAAEQRSWQTVQIGTGSGAGTSLVGDVDFFSVQEHDVGGGSGGAAGALITRDGTVYTWGNNNGSMIGAPGGAGANHVGKPNYLGGAAGEQKAKLIEVGGHTTVFLPKSSPQFCYVGHQIQGSMGDGVISTATQSAFNCSATPVLNICGTSGFDYGDAPKGYENSGGSNQAMHFYANGGDNPNDNKLFLGAFAPQQNDQTPKNVVSGTKNVGSYGDYIPGPPTLLWEEDGIVEAQNDLGNLIAVTPGDELPHIVDSATSYSLKVQFTNTSGKAATVYAWVDWDNDGIFQTSEAATANAPTGVSGGSVTLNWTVSGLEEGYRYIRLRITTATAVDANYNARFPAENVIVRTNEDKRALGFALDGEIEDHRVRVVKASGVANVPPVAVDVTTAPVGLGTAPTRLVLPGTSTAAKLAGTDTDGAVVSYQIISLPTNGTLYRLDGSIPVPITTIPPGGLFLEADTELWYAGADPVEANFTFKAIDNNGDMSDDTATYTIPKAQIKANGDSAVTTPGTGVMTPVTTNDWTKVFDGSGNETTPAPGFGVTGKTNGANGNVVCTATACTYTPSVGYTGTDSYTYTICMAAPNTHLCDTATVTVNVALAPPNIDMGVEVTVPATPVPYGSTQTVTAVCTNNGNANATGATCGIGNPGPGNGTLTLQGGACTPASPQATLAPGGTITCTYDYVAPGPGKPSIDLTGTTSAGNETAGNAGNNTQTKAVKISGPDVFAKIQSPATANPGDQVTTLVTFGNQGDQPADGVTYEVTHLPPDLDGVQCTGATCDYDPATGKVTITGLPTTLAGGQQNQVALKWKTPAATANYTLTATTATTTANDPLPNNTADAPLAVAAGAGQSVAEVTTAVQVPATAGTNQPVTGKVTYTNIGSVTATGVTYKVALDGGVTPTVSYKGAPCTVAGDGTLSGCNLPTVLLQGESLELAVSYPAPATAGQQRTVTSTVGATNDGDSANNQATGQTAAQATAPSTTPDVTTTVAPPAKVTPGKTVKVPVTFTNISPTTPATGVTYTLTLPDGTQDVACTLPTTCTVTGGSGSDVVVTVNNLPTTLQPGQSVPMELTYTAPASGSVQIASRVDASGELPADQGNNAAVAASAVNAAPGPDMAIDVTTLPPTVVPGVPYEGSFTCTNLSATDAATNATCTVTGLPTNVTTQSCTIDGAPWAQPGIVPAGKQVVCTVGGTPPIGNTTTDTNVKGTTGSDGDADPGNNISDQPVRVVYPDMSIDLSGLPGSAIVGKLYEGSFTCTNTTANPAPADAATVCAVTSLPAGISMGACAIGGTTWNQREAVPAGATILCQVSGTPTGGGSTVQGDTNTPGDSNNGNNQRTKAITVTAAPDLAAGPTGGTLPPGTLGKPYTGGFTCSNQGSADATGAACDITGLPNGLNKGACTIDTAVPAPGWSNGDTIPMGATVTCAITGTPTAATPGPVTTTVTTSTTSAPGDSNLGDNTQSPTITIAAVSPTGIPTLSQWGLLALSGLLAFLGMARRRRV